MNGKNSEPSLRELIERATPGPWESPQTKPLIFTNEEGQNFSGGDWIIYPPLGESGPVGIFGYQANAELSARCSPATMAAVLEALEVNARQGCDYSRHAIALLNHPSQTQEKKP